MKIIKILSILLVSFQLVACDQIAVEEICEQKIDMKSQCPCLAEVFVTHDIVEEKEVKECFNMLNELAEIGIQKSQNPLSELKSSKVGKCMWNYLLRLGFGANPDLTCFTKKQKKCFMAILDKSNICP